MGRADIIATDGKSSKKLGRYLPSITEKCSDTDRSSDVDIDSAGRGSYTINLALPTMWRIDTLLVDCPHDPCRAFSNVFQLQALEAL